MSENRTTQESGKILNTRNLQKTLKVLEMGKKNEGEEKKKSDKSHSEYQEAK
jgi:hypothetical protein